LDVNDVETPDRTQAITIKYTIVVPVAVSGPSVSNIIVDTTDAQGATFNIDYPVASTSPISGEFYVNCYLP
jgi:hypothetical protein